MTLPNIFVTTWIFYQKPSNYLHSKILIMPVEMFQPVGWISVGIPNRFSDFFWQILVWNFRGFGFHRIFTGHFFFVFVPPPQMTKKGIYKRGYGREGVQLEGDPGVPWSWGPTGRGFLSGISETVSPKNQSRPSLTRIVSGPRGSGICLEGLLYLHHII